MDVYDDQIPEAPENHVQFEALNELEEMEELKINITGVGAINDEHLTADEELVKAALEVLITSVNYEGTERFLRYPCDASTVYRLLKTVSPLVHSRYFSITFHGLAIDTCCAFASTCSIEQYCAYSKLWVAVLILTRIMSRT